MERKYLGTFSADYSYFPFTPPTLYGEHGFSNEADYEQYLQKIPTELMDQCIAWANYLSNNYTDGTAGNEEFSFASQEQRAYVDREYIRLANALADLGFEFKLDIWW